MRPLVICGAGSESLADQLIGRLDGRVGVVYSDGAGSDRRTTPEATSYRYDTTGWEAYGSDELSIDEILDRLTPAHDYTLVLDCQAALPTIVLGDADTTGEILLRAETATDVDIDALTEALNNTDPRETLESLIASVKRSPKAPLSGAIATFTGRVRRKDHTEDAPTEYLQFEKYDGVADRRMQTIETDLEEREGVLDVRLYHRTGSISYGEDIVFVVVLAAHRAEAFATVEDGIDRLKQEVPLFKKEVTTEETFWVHEQD
jgi:molybdopterin synthase catalytic subunit